MTKHRKIQLVTMAVLAVALGIGLARLKHFEGPFKTPFKTGAQSQTPQDTIYAMLAAARAGNVKAYLANYTGPMEASLRQALSETTEPAFAKYLRDSNSAFKGIALSDPQMFTDGETKMRVEYVYQDRNEAQTMYLEKGQNGWKISRADSEERVKTLIPYGTPVR